MEVVYFSSISENTKRFVDKLGLPEESVHRIPLRRGDSHLTVDEPYILITPTYGAGSERGTVPHQVVRFLNDPDNRAHLRGVVAAGNTNFGQHYGLAGKLVAKKCGVPLLHLFEILGMPDDVTKIHNLLKETP